MTVDHAALRVDLETALVEAFPVRDVPHDELKGIAFPMTPLLHPGRDADRIADAILPVVLRALTEQAEQTAQAIEAHSTDLGGNGLHAVVASGAHRKAITLAAAVAREQAKPGPQYADPPDDL